MSFPTRGTSSVLELWTWVASTLASFMFIWAMLSQFLPYNFRHLIDRSLKIICSKFHPYVEITIPEHSGGARLKSSEAYTAVQSYLSALSSTSARRLIGEIGRNGRQITLSMGDYERVQDVFHGVKLWWVSGKSMSPSSRVPYGYGHLPDPERRFFSLTFHQKHRELVTGRYLDYVVNSGKEIKVKNRQRKLYTNVGSMSRWSSYGHGSGMWSYIPFKHPATFECLAMDPNKKKEIVDDLVKFKESKEFYGRVGKAWKRGYLLFGPPGSGKSTMIAAMANLLEYDVFDLELTAVRDNTELRRLLIETTSKSIIVIEDIDCSLELTGQRKKMKKKTEEDKVDGSEEKQDKENENGNVGSKVTLSGLLNFIDGIWSSSGNERVIVFTTNYVEKLDPALIRRGRMDKHIEMGYCGHLGFKVLAKNYLRLDDHVLFEKIEELLSEVEITPADVAEMLMTKSAEEDADKCLENLVVALQEAKAEAAVKIKGNEEGVEQQPKRNMEEEIGEVMDGEIQECY